MRVFVRKTEGEQPLCRLREENLKGMGIAKVFRTVKQTQEHVFLFVPGAQTKNVFLGLGLFFVTDYFLT